MMALIPRQRPRDYIHDDLDAFLASCCAKPLDDCDDQLLRIDTLLEFRVFAQLRAAEADCSD